MCVHRDSAA
jgi:calcium-dependent protein kinase